MRARGRPGRPAPLLVAVCVLCGGSARAQDAFEIQVYESDTAAPRDTGFELHYNTFVEGHRAAGPDGELPTHGVTHLTLEPHLGLTGWAEAGFYLQTAVRGDGLLDFGGIKLRFKMRIPRRYRGFGFAVNFEVAHVPETYEVSWGSEVRPIIDVHAGPFYASLNPIVSFDLSGPLAGRPQLQPCLTALIEVGAGVALGLEYFTALGPIDALLPFLEQVHRVFAVGNKEWELGRVVLGIHVGVGYGLAASERWLVKSILTVDLLPID